MEDPRRCSGAARFPGSLTEEVRPRRRPPHTPQAERVKGQECALVGASGAAQEVAPHRGGCAALGVGLQQRRPRSPGQRGTQPRILTPPQDRRRPGGARIAGMVLPAGALKQCWSAPPIPGTSSPVQTGSCGCYCGN